MTDNISLSLQYNINNMDHPVAGDVVSLDDVSHRQTAGDGHLAGELCQGQPLPRPSHQGSAALGEPAGGKTTLGHVSQQGQLQLLLVGNHRLEISLFSRLEIKLIYLEKSRWKAIKGFICRSEYCEGTLRREEVYQVRQLQH